MVKAKMTGETEYCDAYLEELVREIVNEPPIPCENTSHLEEAMHDANESVSNEVQNFEQPENCTDVFICSVCHENVRDADMDRHHERYHPEISREVNLFQLKEKSYEEAMHDADESVSNEVQNFEQLENCTDAFICSVCHENVRDADMDRHHERYHPEISREVNLFQLKEKSCEETPDEQLDVDDETERPEAIEPPEQPRQSFICVACDAHVNDVDMDEHHTTYHSMIPFETNIFQLKETPSCGETIEKKLDIDEKKEQPEATEQPEKQTETSICIVCGVVVGVTNSDMKQHHLKYHPHIKREVHIFRLKEELSCGERTEEQSDMGNKKGLRPLGPIHFCDACHRHFRNVEMYSYHVKNHDKYDGINFQYLGPNYYSRLNSSRLFRRRNWFYGMYV